MIAIAELLHLCAALLHVFFISALGRLGGSVDSFPVLGLGSSLNKKIRSEKSKKISIYWQLNSPDSFASIPFICPKKLQEILLGGLKSPFLPGSTTTSGLQLGGHSSK